MSERIVPLRITDTTLRDAHQSLLATRLRTEDMSPIAPKIDRVGFHSVEVWGGATFDTCMRFLNEDPWERLRQLKAAMPNTPFQMLLRGQNLVGYRHYPDDIVERFIIKARENGIDIFRIFDALNDVRNMLWAMQVVKREGGHVQVAICYTTSPIHHVRTFVRLATELEELGADSLCIKDMAGLVTPQVAFELVARIKYVVKIPVQFHTHFTSGMATAACINAAEAGVDVVDAAISSMALGTSQPPVETLVGIFEGTRRDTGLDLDLLMEIAAYFSEVRRRYAHFEGSNKGVDVSVLRYQIPGGMISNLIAQLREQNALDRYQEVMAEVPRVRADLGYPPLVTPSSQIVGTQATLNVLLGERYKVIPKEVQAYLKGLYGQPPGPVNEDLRHKAIGDEKPITCRPADLLEPGYEKAKQEIGELAKSEEDVLSYTLFPQVARDFLERRASGVRLEDEAVATIAAVLAHQEGWVAKRPGSPVRVALSPWKLGSRSLGRSGGWIRW